MIKTEEQLGDAISKDLIWRKIELTQLKSNVQSHSRIANKESAVVRCGVAMLYAHWEGFVKTSSANYLEYISSLKLNYGQLTPNFIALSIRAKFDELSESGKLLAGIKLAKFFSQDLDKRATLPFKNTINTQSNLSSTVLKDIMACLGFDIKIFELRWNFIDSNVVNPRNYIVHGESWTMTPKEYYELHDDVIILLDTYKNTIENAIATKQYLKK